MCAESSVHTTDVQAVVLGCLRTLCMYVLLCNQTNTQVFLMYPTPTQNDPIEKSTLPLVAKKVMKILVLGKSDQGQSCSEFHAEFGGFCLFLS